VGSTQWAQRFELGDLSRALSRFDSVVTEIVVAHGGRVVKLIGDEVMFIARTPDDASMAALAMLHALQHDDVLPSLRAGVASGEVVARDGDYEGPVVNLAARAAKLAMPNSLLVDDATCNALDRQRFAARMNDDYILKGFSERVRLYEVTTTDAAR
jgi:adenylate cyclase